MAVCDRWECAIEALTALTRQLGLNPEPQRMLQELFDYRTVQAVPRRRSWRSRLRPGR